jgi:hypothetical protein
MYKLISMIAAGTVLFATPSLAQQTPTTNDTTNTTLNLLDIGEAGSTAIKMYYENLQREQEARASRNNSPRVTYCTTMLLRDRNGKLTGREIRRCN